jgi:tetratricopeptide (TPR) repeat protein
MSLLIVFIALPLYAANKDEIYKAYISGDMVKWKQVIDNMELQKNKTYLYISELLNYQYGYIGWCIGEKRFNEAETYIAKGYYYIQLLEKNKDYQSIVNSYKSAFYGFKIGLNKLQAPFIGPKSVDCAKRSIELDPLNAHGYIQLGNSEYYMPAAFGGSKQLAIQYYEKALMLFEQNPEKMKNDWNYLSLLTQIARAFETIQQYEKAGFYYNKILTIEPLYKWVKDELYPIFLKKNN